MGIRNGLRIFTGNFSLVWKHLLFMLVSAAITVGVFLLSSFKVTELLRESGWFESVGAMLELVYTSPKELAQAVSNVATNLYALLRDNFSSLWGSYLLTALVALVLPAFLYNIGEFVLGALVYGRTSSLHSQSYFIKFVSTLGQSTVYAFVKMLVTIPFLGVAVGILYAYGVLANSAIGATLMLPILIILLLYVYSARFTLLIGFMPEAVLGGNTFKAFYRGIDEYNKNYFKKSLNYFALFLMELVFIVFVFIFSVGAGLIVVIPAVCLVNTGCTYSNYYLTRKENYYAGEDTIIKPVV